MRTFHEDLLHLFRPYFSFSRFQKFAVLPLRGKSFGYDFSGDFHNVIQWSLIEYRQRSFKTGHVAATQGVLEGQ